MSYLCDPVVSKIKIYTAKKIDAQLNSVYVQLII